MHLADIVMRRTTLAITGALTARDLDAIAAVAAAALGWDADQPHREWCGDGGLTGRHRLNSTAAGCAASDAEYSS